MDNDGVFKLARVISHATGRVVGQIAQTDGRYMIDFISPGEPSKTNALDRVTYKAQKVNGVYRLENALIHTKRIEQYSIALGPEGAIGEIDKKLLDDFAKVPEPLRKILLSKLAASLETLVKELELRGKITINKNEQLYANGAENVDYRLDEDTLGRILVYMPMDNGSTVLVNTKWDREASLEGIFFMSNGDVYRFETQFNTGAGPKENDISVHRFLLPNIVNGDEKTAIEFDVHYLVPNDPLGKELYYIKHGHR